MEKTGIINFADFFGDKDPKKSFNKEDFNDFFLTGEQTTEVVEELDINESMSETEEEKEVKSLEKEVDNLSQEVDELEKEVEKEQAEEEIHTNESSNNYYSVFKDKSEDFSCDIAIEGADLTDTQARLIIESDEWTLMFNGEINNKGKCIIPIKKLGILNEGATGKIRLEVIADGTVFTPWEDDFKVKVSKKVAVKIHESKSNPKKTDPKKTTGVKVSVKR